MAIGQSDGTMVPICKVKRDGNCLKKLFHNDSVVKKLYHGDDLLFRAVGVSPSLTLSTNSIEFESTGGTNTVTVVSSNPYTATTNSNWITLAQSGQTLSITVGSPPSGTISRDGTITVSTSNDDFTTTQTISVLQNAIQFVDYVYVNARDNSNTYIDTGIYPTTATTFRIKAQVIEGNGGCVVGFAPSETPLHCSSDNTDYRYINNNGEHSAWLDFNSQRIQNKYVETDANGMNDITFGNNYIQDNLTGQVVGTAATQSSMATTTVPIYLNLSNRGRTQSLEIYQGDTLVFNGHAAIKDGVYGIWDSVTSTLLQPYQQVYTVLGGNFE